MLVVYYIILLMEFALLQIVNMGLLGNIHDVKVSPIIFLHECCVILAGREDFRRLPQLLDGSGNCTSCRQVFDVHLEQGKSLFFILLYVFSFIFTLLFGF